MNIYQMLSYEDATKILEFKRAYKMAMNPNDERKLNEIIDVLFENVAYNYVEYREQIPFVPADKEKYKFHILQPVNGRYSLLDFLINRAFANVDGIIFSKGNHYNSSHRQVMIDFERYSRYVGRYTNDRINLLYRKSMLHETGHALHGWDRCNDGDIHTSTSETVYKDCERNVGFIHKLQNAERLALHANYRNMLRTENIRGIQQRSRSLNDTSYSKPNINEAATEYFACKYSGLFQSLNEFEYADIVEGSGYRVKVPTHTNGYQHSIRFIYHLENLISKQSMFDSTFFGSNETFKELSEKYRSIIEGVWERNSSMFPEGHESNTYSKVNWLFNRAFLHGENWTYEGKREKLIAQTALDRIFYNIYKEEYEKGNIPKGKMMEIVKYSYKLSPEFFDQNKRTWINSVIKEEYGEWQRELNGELTQRDNRHSEFPENPEDR